MFKTTLSGRLVHADQSFPETNPFVCDMIFLKDVVEIFVFRKTWLHVDRAADTQRHPVESQEEAQQKTMSPNLSLVGFLVTSH